ncbi:MAG: NAD(+) diphosphatase [Bacteroidaceae bacterium]|nr:NAD(+) diphosphatase [Bacteroidaceae bacterium]
MKWFIFHNGQLLLEEQDGNLRVPESEEPPVAVPEGHKVHEVTMNNGTKVKTFEIEDIDIQQSITNGQSSTVNGQRSMVNGQWSTVNGQRKLIGLRDSFNYIPFEDYLCGGKASQILYWDNHSRYCPTCGVPTVQETPIMKKCPKCGLEMYPPIATAIIVLIQKGDEILLVHNRAFKRNYYGLVAGFLEAGESLEQCVHREVMEETGLTIKNLRYFGSQTWPYPSGLMVGFTAEYDSGTIKLQEDELSAGAFYRKDNLPHIPQKMSIARKLIDWWLTHER